MAAACAPSPRRTGAGWYTPRAWTQTALRIRDLQTQEDHWLVAEMQRDDQEGYAPNDILPGYAFTPDSRAVVFTAGGHIQRVELATRQIRTIPFHAHVEQGVATRHRAALRIEDGDMPVRNFLGVQPSPDGRSIAFSAVGKVWVSELRGTPRRATDSPGREYEPAFSPDGQWIAYVSWSDSAGGHVWKVRGSGGSPVRLTQNAGYYQSPVWSPEGDRVVYAAASVRAGQGAPEAGLGELRWVSANGGEAHRHHCGQPSPMTVQREATRRVSSSPRDQAVAPARRRRCSRRSAWMVRPGDCTRASRRPARAAT